MWLAMRKSVWTKKIGVIALLSFALTFVVAGSDWRSYQWIVSFVVTLILTAALWLGLTNINRLLNKYLSWTQQPALRLTLGIISFISYTLLVNIVVMELLEWYLNWEISRQDYQRNLFISIAVSAFISPFQHARTFLINWRQTAIDKEQLEKEHIVGQYQSLRNQVNPQFLFNSLDVLAELVHQDADRAEQFVSKLSRVYRYVLEKRDAELVSLQEELDFIKRFVFLQDSLQPYKLQLQCPELLSETHALPPLALQLLVENAIQNHVAAAGQPLSLSFKVDNDYLLFGYSLQAGQQAADGPDLGSLINRYKYLTTKAVAVEQSDTHFRVGLPLLKLPAT
ncbi:signal transduction histidine kinase [Flammeovirgaceae bacterium 311]|nr:signal transduction histidine kinase [Flammeovirgaceae bacterium 311]